MAIKAAVFDLDGTLYPYARLIAVTAPLTLRNSRFFAHFARVRVAIRRTRPITDFRALQAELLARSMRIPVAQAGQLIQQVVYEQLEERFRRVRPFPYLAEALRALKESGVRLAVLSDFPVERKLQYLGLAGFWDCALTSEETGYLKPNPEPFQAVAARLALSPGEILFVGDKYLYDILGAHRVGMHTAHLTRVPENHGVADLSFRGYARFAALFEGLRIVGDPHNCQH